MSATLPAGEPAAGPWRRAPLTELLDLVLDRAGRPVGRPAIVAIDGRGASGKSTLAGRLHRRVPASAVIGTDDLAWHEPLFGWGRLLGAALRPLREGRALDLRPPAWEAQGRAGALVVPAGFGLVLVEGTGASWRERAGLVDATVWVQADFAEAERRGLARDVASGVNGDAGAAAAFWHDWMAAELRFLERQRPWERACVVVNGTPTGPLADDEVEVAPPPTHARRDRRAADRRTPGR